MAINISVGPPVEDEPDEIKPPSRPVAEKALSPISTSEAASDMFEGPVAIAYSEDFTAAPKVVVEFAKSNDKFDLVGGFMEEEVFDAKGVEALSKLPSREELIGAIAGRLLGQAGEIVSRLTAPGNTLAAQIETIREKAEA